MPGDPLETAVDLIRSYGAVVVVGAGLSMSRYPMTAQLPAMLAHAFDLSPHDRRELADRLGRPDGPAKGLLVGDVSVRIGWEIAHRLGETRAAFQHAVMRHDLDREPSPAHKALARLIHAGVVRYLISFNWDTAIERAYEQYFGHPIPAGMLVKPHGDAAKPDEPWILPFQDEVIPPAVTDRMAELKGAGPHLFLVVGYSGSDPVVVEELLDPVREFWPTRRVNPSATGDEGIAATAETALPAIADALGAFVDVSGWLWVTYDRTRDLGAALLGHKLGPQDVYACPQVPAVEVAARNLARAGFAVISGESGGGKSLAAFHAGRLRNREGWGVLELVSEGVASMDDVRAFVGVRGPVLAIVDDSQALDPAVRTAFERSVDKDHAVLMVSTDSSDRPEHSTIRPDQAIATIRQFCLDHREVVSRLVSSVDDRVGRGPISERFEERVAAAAFAKMPWEFMFILGGGERRVSESIEGLSDTDEGALLLGLVAVTEILSLDAGVGVDRLAELASDVGRDRDWVEEVLAALVGRRLASIRAGRVRTPHIRLAQQALWALCRDTTGSHWDRLADLIARRFADTTESLKGRQWLSSMLSNSDSNLRRRNRLFPDDVAGALMEEISTVTARRERSVAGEMIWEINSWWAMTDELAEMVEHVLVRWLPEMTSDDVHGVFRAFSALHQHRSNASRVSSSIAPEQVAAIVSNEIDIRWGHDWGWLLTGLAHAEGIDPDPWRERFARALDLERLIDRVTTGIADQVAGAVDFIHSLGQLAPMAAAECIRAITPAVIRVIESDLPFAAHALFDWCPLEFTMAAMIRNRSSDSASPNELDELVASAPGWVAIANALADLVDATDWASAGRSISATDCDLEDLDALDLLGYAISRLAPDRWSEAMAGVDLDHLDKISHGEWAPTARVARLVYTLSSGSDPSPGRRWAERHVGELERVTPFLATAAPELAIKALHRGIPIVLTNMNGGDIVARALDAMAAVDTEATKAALPGNEEQIVSALGSEHSSSWEGIEKLVQAIDKVDPEWLDERLSEVDDLQTYRARWSAYEADDGPTTRAAQFLLERTARST